MHIEIAYHASVDTGSGIRDGWITPPEYVTLGPAEVPADTYDGPDDGAAAWIAERLQARLNGVTFVGQPLGRATSVLTIHDDEHGYTADVTAHIRGADTILAEVRLRMEDQMRADRLAALALDGLGPEAMGDFGWEDGLPDSVYAPFGS